jgi:K+-transporting ATPase KdpF subunit
VRAASPWCSRAGGRSRMTGAESVIGLALSVLVAAYLVYALLFPEKL